jgi:hypothetical protein
VRRGEVVLLVGLAVALVVAAYLGRRAAPPDALLDPRRSTLLAGPEGARGLAAALESLGVRVERRRRSWLPLGEGGTGPSGDALVLLLDVERIPTGAEHRVLTDHVARGGSMLLAGRNGVERCFGARAGSLLYEDGPDSLQVDTPGLARVPWTRWVLEMIPPDSLEPDEPVVEPTCAPLLPLSVDTLLRARDGRPAAWRMQFRGGGRVIQLADARYVSNRALRDSDAGILVLPWILGERRAWVVFDEYHHGFGTGGSVVRATGRWLVTTPMGWALLQLGLAGMILLLATALRFGPALHVIDRRRRSSIEHVEALAAGLQRAHGVQVAVDLVTRGLQRRLRGRGRASRRAAGAVDGWLAALRRGVREPEARAKIDVLAGIVRKRGGDERVLEAATAVEDVWEVLTREHKPTAS